MDIFSKDFLPPQLPFDEVEASFNRIALLLYLRQLQVDQESPPAAILPFLMFIEGDIVRFSPSCRVLEL